MVYEVSLWFQAFLQYEYLQIQVFIHGDMLAKKSREKSYDIKKSLCVIFGSCYLTYEYLLVNSATYTTSLGNDHTTENESLWALLAQNPGLHKEKFSDWKERHKCPIVRMLYFLSSVEWAEEGWDAKECDTQSSHAAANAQMSYLELFWVCRVGWVTEQFWASTQRIHRSV